jgi:predicted unusual protein kinase regulating ubiquinone biosynthesis (AarF/ABC1/UbiB family)
LPEIRNLGESLLSEENSPAAPSGGFDRARYVRVVRFFAGAVGQFILWEILLRRLLGRRFVARSREERWQRVAHRFRVLAVEMGGVLIKLGQFLSVRVDVLPRSVTSELAGLQDEVPPERLEDIQAIIETEYGQPLDGVFAWFAPQPEAAASLAQVHRARLSAALLAGGDDGDEVVVKVQRPRIQTIVETDLRAIQTASQWLKRYGPIRRRVDMDRLYEEFAETTRKELDFVAEAENAERFATNFADDPGVRIPRVHTGSSTRRVLIMEDVANIKISDDAAIKAAGIRREEVADRLFNAYLKMAFRHNFVHADPHPGNLFVQPLPVPDRSEAGGRPFRLVFVDFGMVATIPERMTDHLVGFLLGFATRDASRIVRAYEGAGILLPGADLTRLEQMEAELLDRYANLTLREAQHVAMTEWQGLAREYRDILYEMPFQIPTDLLFVGRAMAILFGMATSLNPDFDPWRAIEPFARQVAGEEIRRDWRPALEELQRVVRLVGSLPAQADRFLRQAVQGELMVQAAWTTEATHSVRRVEAAVNRLAWAVIFAALLLAAVALYLGQGPGPLTYVLFGMTVVALLVAVTRRVNR